MTFPGCPENALMRKLAAVPEILSANNFQCATMALDPTMVRVPYDWKMTAYACLNGTASIKLVAGRRS